MNFTSGPRPARSFRIATTRPLRGKRLDPLHGVDLHHLYPSEVEGLRTRFANVGVTREHLAWAAGIIDGEGCIRIGRRHTKDDGFGYSLRLTVKMCDAQTIVRLRAIFGFGHFHTDYRHNPKHATAYAWYCGGRAAFLVLVVLQRYLFTKAEEVKIGIEFMTDGMTTALAPFLDMREELYQKMKAAKTHQTGTKGK